MLKKLKVSWNLSEKERKPLIQLEKRQEFLNWLSRPKIVAIIQARLTSSRLPAKIYKDLGGAPVLYHVVNRVKLCPLISDVVVASPHKLDLPEGVTEFVYYGDQSDVLSRYFHCAALMGADYIVRVTSDCPLWDPLLGEFVIYNSVVGNVDYGANVIKLTFPDGVDTEVIKRETLGFLHQSVKSLYNREHVTTALRDNMNLLESCETLSIENDVDYSKIKTSIDTEEDLQTVRKYV